MGVVLMTDNEKLDVVVPRDETEKKELVKRALDEVYGPEEEDKEK